MYQEGKQKATNRYLLRFRSDAAKSPPGKKKKEKRRVEFKLQEQITVISRGETGKYLSQENKNHFGLLGHFRVASFSGMYCVEKNSQCSQ